VGYVRITTFAMLAIGVLMVIAGLVSDVGTFGVVFGLLMIVSSVVKVVAVRILQNAVNEGQAKDRAGQ
jgi:hypothetical protein